MWWMFTGSVHLACYYARHRLTNPPRRIGTETIPLRTIKALSGPPQAAVSSIDQVHQWHSMIFVSLCNSSYQQEMGLD